MRVCGYCKKELTKRQKNFCSIECNGYFKRGRARGLKPGDSFIRAKNHIRILVEGKRKYFHRYLVEENVRPLAADEIVHHRDDNKFNNDLENLEILSGQHEHLRKHNYWRERRQKNYSQSESPVDADYGW